MRLLIITQRVDAKDPVLGFFVQWIRELSRNAASIEVVTQQTGTFTLPANVTVHSLHKGERSRVGQALRCWALCWRLRHDYDAAFVHMTPIWTVLNGPLWMLLRKRAYLWYESKGRRWPLYIAVFLAEKIFSATPLRLRFQDRKNVVTNHGIDTSFWTSSGSRDPFLITTTGRVTPAKRLEIILDCLAAVRRPYHLFIIGGPFIGSDIAYYQQIERRMQELGLQERVTMHPMDHAHALPIIQRSSLHLHAGDGTLDKSLLEAMACGIPCVSCSPANAVLPPECRAAPATMKTKVKKLLADEALRDAVGMRLRQTVEMQHSLSSLATRLCGEMESTSVFLPRHVASVLSCLLLAGCAMQH